jgi:hypothetical protein
MQRVLQVLADHVADHMADPAGFSNLLLYVLNVFGNNKAAAVRQWGRLCAEGETTSSDASRDASRDASKVEKLQLLSRAIQEQPFVHVSLAPGGPFRLTWVLGTDFMKSIVSDVAMTLGHDMVGSLLLAHVHAALWSTKPFSSLPLCATRVVDITVVQQVTDHSPVIQLDQNPFDFEIIAHTRGISKCSPPWSWMEHWRQLAAFSYGDFAMECFSMPRSGVDEAKFIHCLKLSKRRSAINSLRRGPPNREVGHWTFPAEVLWSACKFGDMKWICPTSKEEYFLEINPTAGCGDIERAVQACLKDVPEGLRDQVSETGRLLQEACVSSPSPSSSGSGSGSLSGSGCLGEACMPAAFEPIESWFHVATDATSLFQAGFCTESRWFWMWSSSS